MKTRSKALAPVVELHRFTPAQLRRLSESLNELIASSVCYEYGERFRIAPLIEAAKMLDYTLMRDNRLNV